VNILQDILAQAERLAHIVDYSTDIAEEHLSPMATKMLDRHNSIIDTITFDKDTNKQACQPTLDAIAELETYLLSDEDAGASGILAELYILCGCNLHACNNDTEALDHFRRALAARQNNCRLSLSPNGLRRLADAYRSLGRQYGRVGQPEDEIKNYTTSYRIFECLSSLGLFPGLVEDEMYDISGLIEELGGHIEEDGTPLLDDISSVSNSHLRRSRGVDGMTPLSTGTATSIFQNTSLRFVFLEEECLPPMNTLEGTFARSGLSSTGDYGTGRYRLALSFSVPERMTGLGMSDEPVLHAIELKKFIETGGLAPEGYKNGVYRFEASGAPPCEGNDFCDTQHHDGKSIYFDRISVENLLISPIYIQDAYDEQLKMTIGLESLNLS